MTVDGAAAGVRVCSPYVFDLTGLAGPGAHTLDIAVFGTPAPRLDATSPTHFVFPGQRVNGLLGPVRWRAAGLTNITCRHVTSYRTFPPLWPTGLAPGRVGSAWLMNGDPVRYG